MSWCALCGGVTPVSVHCLVPSDAFDLCPSSGQLQPSDSLSLCVFLLTQCILLLQATGLGCEEAIKVAPLHCVCLLRHSCDLAIEFS